MLSNVKDIFLPLFLVTFACKKLTLNASSGCKPPANLLALRERRAKMANSVCAKLWLNPSNCFKRETNYPLCFWGCSSAQNEGLTLMWFLPRRSHRRSLLGLTGTTTWWTVSGTESSPFRSTHVGKCMMRSDNFFTSNECRVAEQTIT